MCGIHGFIPWNPVLMRPRPGSLGPATMDFLGQMDLGGLAWRVLCAYLLGGVPFGYLMCRWIKGVDLREIGSGNIGATNAMRVLGKPLGLVAFFLDVFKGYAPVAFLAGDDSSWQVACAAAAVAGHVWPVYLGFRGGKAVATGCGTILAIEPLIFLVAGLVWLLTMVITGFVSISSILMGVSFPVTAWWQEQPPVVIFGTALLTLLIIVRHRSNMSRLLEGSESQIELWKKLRGQRTGMGDDGND